MRLALVLVLLAVGVAQAAEREPVQVFGEGDRRRFARSVVGAGERILCVLEEGLDERRLEGAPRRVLERVTVEAISADGRRALGHWWSTMSIWDLAGRVSLGDVGWLREPRLSPDGRLVAFRARDRELLVKSIDTGEVILRLAPPHGPKDYSLSFLDGDRIVTTGDDGFLCIWDAVTGESLESLSVGASELSTHVAPTSSRVAVRRDKRLDVWNLRTRSRLSSLPLPAKNARYTFDLELTRAAIAHEGSITVVDARTAREIASVGRDGARFTSVAFVGTRHLAASSSEGEVIAWDLETRREVRTHVGHREAIRSIVVSADGKQLTTSGDDSQVIVWDIATATELRRTTEIGSREFVAAIETLALVARDRTIELVAAGEVLKTYDGHTEPVTSLALSRDGELGLSAGRDAVRIWSIRGGWALERFEPASGHATAVAFAPDGRSFFVGTSLGLVLRYER